MGNHSAIAKDRLAGGVLLGAVVSGALAAADWFGWDGDCDLRVDQRRRKWQRLHQHRDQLRGRAGQQLNSGGRRDF
jgi:hypothetical protein